MALLIICGPQAVGKMTVGRELENLGVGKLLYNHQTIDLYANFLGYTPETFALSNETRLALFEAFARNTATNLTKTIIFTVMLNFDDDDDWDFIEQISQIFLNVQQDVYLVELAANVNTRVERNSGAERLAAKPSKRDLTFSKNELLEAHKTMRQNSEFGEINGRLPQIQYVKIDNTDLPATDVAKAVVVKWAELLK